MLTAKLATHRSRNGKAPATGAWEANSWIAGFRAAEIASTVREFGGGGYAGMGIQGWGDWRVLISCPLGARNPCPPTDTSVGGQGFLAPKGQEVIFLGSKWDKYLDLLQDDWTEGAVDSASGHEPCVGSRGEKFDLCTVASEEDEMKPLSPNAWNKCVTSRSCKSRKRVEKSM
ncbi:Uncharacterized protein Fot_31678 [Forsythia ovata]|uniref:Uncharacterized protein n=1 Tax=Forsythia ovata TaxID=205694 RepID=A0ABD1T5Y4_9LAMI